MKHEISTSEIVEVNLFLNDKQKFELSPKSIAAILGGSVESIWIKGKNGLYGTFGVLQIKPKLRTYRFVKDFRDTALNNESINNLIGSLTNVGFTEDF